MEYSNLETYALYYFVALITVILFVGAIMFLQEAYNWWKYNKLRQIKKELKDFVKTLMIMMFMVGLCVLMFIFWPLIVAFVLYENYCNTRANEQQGGE